MDVDAYVELEGRGGVRRDRTGLAAMLVFTGCAIAAILLVALT
jgi:hypothetical protein